MATSSRATALPPPPQIVAQTPDPPSSPVPVGVALGLGALAAAWLFASPRGRRFRRRVLSNPAEMPW